MTVSRWQRVGGTVALGAGVVMPLVFYEAMTTHGPSSASLLVRSSCTGALRITAFGSTPTAEVITITMREPGLYRLDSKGDRLQALATSAERRPVDELPLGPSGERLLPSGWCPNGGGFAIAGLGPLAP